MKKNIIILFLIICFSTAIAQQDTMVNNFDQKNTIISNPPGQKFSLGIKRGINFADMRYSKPEYATYKYSPYLRTLFGLSAEVFLTPAISFKPDILLIGKGVKITDGTNYKMKLKAIDFNLPLVYTFRVGNMYPYLLAGTSLSLYRGGKITLDRYETEVSKANISNSSLALRTGIGVKSQSFTSLNAYLCAEIAYNYGLTNTWSSQELSGRAEGLNIDPYTISGTRKSVGLEFSVTLMVPVSRIIKRAMPMANKGVSIVNSFFTSNPKEESESPFVNPTPTQEPVIAEEKEYYTISEIIELIDNGQDVVGKKIMFQTITFETNKAVLKQESNKIIDEVIELMKKADWINMNISGHTDNVGTSETNTKLSEQRAKTVSDYITTKGIDKNKLSYEGRGEKEPIETNDTKEGRAKNRRVEFEIVE